MAVTVRSPAALVLAEARAVNARLGHENLGSLSESRGFVPLAAPRLTLPSSHAAWDQAVNELPQMYRTLDLRRKMDAMPVLSADRGELPDAALLRAATVLGILAHAYYYVCTEPPDGLPAAIALPWAQVRHRLGRHGAPVLSYLDLIVNNWRLVDPAAPDPFTFSNLQLLVPTADNQEERVFYLTQLEILARSAPLVPAIAAAQDAVLGDNPDLLGDALAVVRDTMEGVRKSLARIDPRPVSATHVDAVIWAKTVAPLAVPFRPGVLGPSGTASPIFNLLDAFLGRPAYDSQLGQEILRHRAAYPRHWRRLLTAVEQVSIPQYVARRGVSQLVRQLETARDAYAGPEGFLGQHRRKVFGYLQIAFKVGRGVTIGGFSGQLHDRAWEDVDDALAESGSERQPSAPTPEQQRVCGPPRPRTAPTVTAPDTAIRISELTQHNDVEHGCWIAVRGRVHDVTRLLERHPGGHQVLLAHAGIDATKAFRLAHRSDGRADQLRCSVDIGHLRHPQLPGEPVGSGTLPPRSAYSAWVRALFLAVEMQNILRLDRSFTRGTTVESDAGSAPSPYVLDRATNIHHRFLTAYMPPFVDYVLMPLIRLTEEAFPSGDDRDFRPDAAAPDPTDQFSGWTPTAAQRERSPGQIGLSPRQGGDLDTAVICRGLLDLDELALATIQGVLRQGIIAFERDADVTSLSDAVRSATRRLLGSAGLDPGDNASTARRRHGTVSTRTDGAPRSP